MTCIRRSYSTWTTCSCVPCTDDRNRHQKLARNGKISRVPSEQAWAKIDVLVERGWSQEAIGSAAGLTGRYIRSLVDADRDGRRPHIGPVRAAQIVAISDTPTAGYVPVTGARRRLQALATMRHGVTELSEYSGIHRTPLHIIKSGRTRTIHATLNVAVKNLYDDLAHTMGGSKQTATLATQKRYAPPAAWTPATIDDPNAAPLSLVERRNRHADDVVDDVQHLARAGETIEGAATRLDMKPDSLERALRRADRADLLELLRRNDPAWVHPDRYIGWAEGRRIVAHRTAGATHSFDRSVA